MTKPVHPEHVRRFPYPFDTDTYRYTTNVEPARTRRDTAAGSWGENIIDVGSDYAEVLALREEILQRDPRRHVALPHMVAAGADAARVILAELVRSRPDLTPVPEPTTDPLLNAAKQIQDDVVLLDQRDGELHADSGVVTFASDWSLNFDLGMSFLEIHRPVPRLIPEHVAARAQSVLLALDVGQWLRRTNWSTGIDHRLDASAETRSEWEPARRSLITAPAAEVGRRLCLRVEVQHLTRLAPSGAIMFLIRTYMLSLDDLATVPGWAERFVEVVRELPSDIADYKGLTPLKPAIDRWWAGRRPGDDGSLAP